MKYSRCMGNGLSHVWIRIIRLIDLAAVGRVLLCLVGPDVYSSGFLVLPDRFHFRICVDKLNYILAVFRNWQR